MTMKDGKKWTDEELAEMTHCPFCSKKLGGQVSLIRVVDSVPENQIVCSCCVPDDACIEEFLD